MKLSALPGLLLLLTPELTLAAPPHLTPAEINADILGDTNFVPGDHRVKPYVEGLPDPYRKFADEADPMEVLGE
jgi:hypothetical protein